MTIESMARKVAQQISLPKQTTSPPALVLITGLPGSGKSYFSQRLAPRISAAIISTDMVRRTLFHKPRYTRDEHHIVFGVSHWLMANLLQRGYSVIFDATNLNENKRRQIYKIAEKAAAKLVVVRTVASEEVVRQRLERRGHQPSPTDLSEADYAVYRRMKRQEQTIRRQHFVVDTTQDIEPALRDVLTAIAS